MSETHTYTQVIPLHRPAQLHLGVQQQRRLRHGGGEAAWTSRSRRARGAIRVILMEFSRIMDHLVCIGTNLVDMGALTNFWYFFRPREEIYELIERLLGRAPARSTYGRVGGVAQDIPRGLRRARAPASPWRCCRSTSTTWTSWSPRTSSSSAHARHRRGHARQDAIAWGWTGPCLRATGVASTCRKARSLRRLRELEFEVPVRTDGDTFDRYMVRMEEMRAEPAHHRSRRSTAAARGPAHHATTTRVALPREGAGLHQHRSADEPLQADHARASSRRSARSTPTPRRRTASWASTWSPTAPGKPLPAARAARPASASTGHRRDAARARWSRTSWPSSAA